VPRTQAALAQARGRLIVAQNDEQVARVVLDNAIGAETSTKYQLVDDRTEWRLGGTLENFLALAMSLRPELAELRGRLGQVEGRLEWARGGYYPALAGTASVNARGTGGAGNFFNYDVGALMVWNIFEGYLYRNQVQEANERMKSLNWSGVELQQRIELEVRAAHAQLQSAAESIAAARVTAMHAEENLKLATARFRSGLAPIIELADAEELQVTAAAALVRAIYDYKIAAANLERAVGRRLPRQSSSP
jgi:outer membrane protein TolC